MGKKWLFTLRLVGGGRKLSSRRLRWWEKIGWRSSWRSATAIGAIAKTRSGSKIGSGSKSRPAGLGTTRWGLRRCGWLSLRWCRREDLYIFGLGYAKPECRSLAFFGFDTNGATVLLDDAFADSQSQPRPTFLFGVAGLDLLKSLEQSVFKGLGYASTSIGDVDFDQAARYLLAGDSDAGSLGRKLNCVGHQIDYDLHESIAIGMDSELAGSDIEDDTIIGSKSIDGLLRSLKYIG